MQVRWLTRANRTGSSDSLADGPDPIPLLDAHSFAADRMIKIVAGLLPEPLPRLHAVSDLGSVNPEEAINTIPRLNTLRALNMRYGATNLGKV